MTTAPAHSICWCGHRDLLPFGEHYRRCPACETLVAIRRPAGDVTHVGADEAGLYGRNYWFNHQEQDVGLPNIHQRARSDLPERCVHWLRTMLKYKLPPARVQELGSAHGGFIALARWAGYDAAGLELSPWISDFAKRMFDVPMLQGPIEEQPIPPGSLSALVMMDVLEHLPDPLATMRHAYGLLARGGFFLVQTPCYPQGVVYETLVERDDYFLNHLRGKQEEHLYLFSKTGVRELFRRIGCPFLVFEPAIFRQYDMYFIAAAGEVRPHSQEEIDAALLASPSGRLVRALLDACDQRDLYQVEAGKRLEVIEGLAAEVERLKGQ